MFQVDWSFLTPLIICHYVKSSILETKMYNLSTLKAVMTSGSKINKNAIEEFKKALPHVAYVNLYGRKFMIFK